MQKVGNVTFRIVDSNLDMGFLWKDGTLYLTLNNVMLTDGNIWYEIPIKNLERIDREGGAVSFEVESMTLTVKGKNAERLMALRYLLLPLIEGTSSDDDLTESIIKLMLLGIREESIMASLLKRDVEDVRASVSYAENNGLIRNGEVTEKGKKMLPPDERALLEEADMQEVME